MIWYGASSFFFAAMGICTKLLGQYHYPVWEITFFRAIIILACCLSMLVSAGTSMMRPQTSALATGMCMRVLA